MNQTYFAQTSGWTPDVTFRVQSRLDDSHDRIPSMIPVIINNIVTERWNEETQVLLVKGRNWSIPTPVVAVNLSDE